jgi:hypothetical protein
VGKKFFHPNNLIKGIIVGVEWKEKISKSGDKVMIAQYVYPTS